MYNFQKNMVNVTVNIYIYMPQACNSCHPFGNSWASGDFLPKPWASPHHQGSSLVGVEWLMSATTGTSSDPIRIQKCTSWNHLDTSHHLSWALGDSPGKDPMMASDELLMSPVVGTSSGLSSSCNLSSSKLDWITSFLPMHRPYFHWINQY